MPLLYIQVEIYGRTSPCLWARILVTSGSFGGFHKNNRWYECVLGRYLCLLVEMEITICKWEDPRKFSRSGFAGVIW